MANYNDLLGPARAPAGKRHLGETSQRQVLSGRAADMHVNAAGGYVFTLDDWTILRRFLILGTTQGTYYASSEQMGNEALLVIDRALAADPVKFVDILVEISLSGAPLKQSPCIFALARACSRVTGDTKRDTDQKDPVTIGRSYALAHAPQVLRTLQHVFEFTDYCRRQRGGGSGLLKAIGAIFMDRSVADVEYQALKYRQRVGWTPRDALRYAHPKTSDEERRNLFGWIVKPESDAGRAAVANSPRLAAFEELQAGPSLNRAVELITDHRMTHEFVPNELLNQKVVWEALLPNLPLTALVRNLRKMTQVGLLVDGSAASKIVREKLTNVDALRKARMHPLRIMGAMGAYSSGESRYGHGSSFIPSGYVLATLEDALELSWGSVTPLNKSVVVAIDKSGSMSQASPMAGLTAFHACLALATWYKRTEERCTILLFDHTASVLNVSSKVTFSEMKRISNPSGSTNLNAPLEWLAKNPSVDPELIITMTDNETWSGKGHYVEGLTKLRKKVSHPIAASIAAVTATKSTVADPSDPHSLEVVGFDPTVPEALAAFTNEVFGS